MAGQERLIHYWDMIAQEWRKAPAVVRSKRVTATGQVVAWSVKLYWASMNPSAANAAAELTDDLTGLAAVVFDMFHASRDHMHMVLSPPMLFADGLWLKTLTNMTSVIFGYVESP